MVPFSQHVPIFIKNEFIVILTFREHRLRIQIFAYTAIRFFHVHIRSYAFTRGYFLLQILTIRNFKAGISYD